MTLIVHGNLKIIISDILGLDFSGFGWAWAFMYWASSRPGFFVSGFGIFWAFPKYKMKYEVFLVKFFQQGPNFGQKWAKNPPKNENSFVTKVPNFSQILAGNWQKVADFRPEKAHVDFRL